MTILISCLTCHRQILSTRLNRHRKAICDKLPANWREVVESKELSLGEMAFNYDIPMATLYAHLAAIGYRYHAKTYRQYRRQSVKFPCFNCQVSIHGRSEKMYNDETRTGNRTFKNTKQIAVGCYCIACLREHPKFWIILLFMLISFRHWQVTGKLLQLDYLSV